MLNNLNQKYNDLEVLHLHIVNHSTFLKHKEKIKNIKPTIMTNKYHIEQDVIRNNFNKFRELNHTFHAKRGNSNEIKDNQLLRNKLIKIFNKESKQIENSDYEIYSPILNKSRIKVRQIQQDKIKEDNIRNKRRLIINSPKSLMTSNKYLEEHYKNHLIYKKFNKSYCLPEIKSQT